MKLCMSPWSVRMPVAADPGIKKKLAMDFYPQASQAGCSGEGALAPHFFIRKDGTQPRSQGFSLEGGRGIFKGKALGTRLDGTWIALCCKFFSPL